MKGALAALFGATVRVLGPYRCWRIFHEWIGSDPQGARALVEYILEAEKPEVPLRKEAIAHWMGDELLVHAVRQQTGQLGSPFYAFMIYRQVLRLCEAHGLRPDRVLEIGPGIHVGSLFCFAASGCSRVAGVDVQPMQKHPEFYRQLKDYLAAAGGFAWWRYTAAVNAREAVQHPSNWDNESADQLLARIDYRTPVCAEALPFEDASFDLVYSITAFEHFPKPAEAMREIKRVLRPGGLTVHEIDMRQHLDMRRHEPAEALGFLAWTEEEHAARSELYGNGKGLENLLRGDWATGERAVYCNRLRLSDYQKLIEAEHLELLQSEPVELLAHEQIERDRFMEPYRSKTMDDLSVLVARVVAKKPA